MNETNEIRFVVIENRVECIEKSIEDLDHELFGNGQPGRFDKIDAKLEDISGKLRNIMLAIGFLGAASGGVAATAIQSLLGG